MAERTASLQACKRYITKQDYGRMTVSFTDDVSKNNFVLTNMYLYQVNDIAFMLTAGYV